MKKEYVKYALSGILYGSFLIILSRCFIYNAGGVFYIVGKILNLDEDLVLHITKVLEQLKNANIDSPWMIVIIISVIIGVLYGLMICRCQRKKLISICLWTILFIPLMLGLVSFTKINDMRISNFWINNAPKRTYPVEEYVSNGEKWNLGFGREQIIVDENTKDPLYIAGYNNGVEIQGVLDYCEARALWIDTGDKGVMLIGIDCVALDSNTVQKIRDSLSDIKDCASINVYSTHTHAGIDTLGMWGPIGIDGKNDDYMKKLVLSAQKAGLEAFNNRSSGTLHFGQVKTGDMYRDSRHPQVYDDNLYQLRFDPFDSPNGIRLFFYGAHAESLRGNNKMLSRDFAGMLCDKVTDLTGDHTMFFPGAIGGLIMTREFVDTALNAYENMEITADKLTAYALSITDEMEHELNANMTFRCTKFAVPMDNTVFWLYKFLGILNNKAVSLDSATGYGVETQMGLIMLDDLAVTLIPGEIFPELVLGGEYGRANPKEKNPEPLNRIASRYGINKMLIVGLANDEIGYIVPPSDFLVNDKKPYLERITDYKGEDHYEETNSIGIECADMIAQTFERLLKN